MDSARQQRVNLVYRADLQTCVHLHLERVFLLLVLQTSCEVCRQLVLDSVAQNWRDWGWRACPSSRFRREPGRWGVDFEGNRGGSLLLGSGIAMEVFQPPGIESENRGGGEPVPLGVRRGKERPECRLPISTLFVPVRQAGWLGASLLRQN